MGSGATPPGGNVLGKENGRVDDPKRGAKGTKIDKNEKEWMMERYREREREEGRRCCGLVAVESPASIDPGLS